MSAESSIPQDSLALLSIEDTVVFPNNTIPFHIFEPHYKSMIADCLDKHGYLCFATEVARKEERHEHRLFHRTGCLLKVIDYHKLSNQNYEVLLECICPVTITEIASNKPYQIVDFEIIEQFNTDLDPEQKKHLQANFLSHISQRISDEDLQKITPKIQAMPSKELINAMAYNCPASTETRQELLETHDLEALIERLGDYYF